MDSHTNGKHSGSPLLAPSRSPPPFASSSHSTHHNAYTLPSPYDPSVTGASVDDDGGPFSIPPLHLNELVSSSGINGDVEVHSPPSTSAAGANGVGVDYGQQSMIARELEEVSGLAVAPEGSSSKKKRKPKVNTAPRTTRACLHCRKQKMRCEGADDPPCRRCRASNTECLFERRSDYILNPNDQAWQKKIEGKIAHLTSTVEQILAALETRGLSVQVAAAPPSPVAGTLGDGADDGLGTDYSAWTGVGGAADFGDTSGSASGQ